MEVKGSEAQRRHREVGSEGSAEQNRDLTYKNRIGGHTDRTNWREAVKSISVKRPWGKSGRCAGISLTQMIEQVSRYLNGWRAYFGFCQTPSVLAELDSWIRRRLRSVVWKQ